MLRWVEFVHQEICVFDDWSFFPLFFFSCREWARVAQLTEKGEQDKMRKTDRKSARDRERERESWQMTLMNAQHDMTSLRHLPKRRKKGKEERKKRCHLYLYFFLLHLSVIQL
jgi:hypothetical protein